MRFHIGEPRSDLKLLGTSCWTNTLKDGGWVAHRFWRPITWWIGISWGGDWFVGLIRTGDEARAMIPENPPQPGASLTAADHSSSGRKP